jgi:hypothetical protein
VINLAFDHLKIPSYKMTYSEVDISWNKSSIKLVGTSNPKCN